MPQQLAINTPNFNFQKPTEGSDADVWGGMLNSNWDKTDVELQATNDAIAALAVRVTDSETQLENLKIKVGDLHLATTADDPATKLGYGTWVLIGEDRALVGAGTTHVGKAEFGEDDRTLTVDQMPSHSHGVNDPGHFHNLTQQVWSRTGDLNKGFVNQGQQADFNTNVQAGTKATGVTIQAAGGGAAHSVVQKSIAVYVWERTA